MTDIIIIGGGPSGLSTAIYAKRAGLSVMVFDKGAADCQLTKATEVENYLGFPSISGLELQEKFSQHAKAHNIQIVKKAVVSVEKNDWEYVNSQNFLHLSVKEGGHWQWFVSIVNKYGLIPYEYMPDSYESLRVGAISTLYFDKVKKEGNENPTTTQSPKSPKEPEPQVSGGGTNDEEPNPRETKVPSWLQNRFR